VPALARREGGMSQNTSHAVMAQRVEAHDSLDWFPTPPWATRALCEWLKDHGQEIDRMTCWEPACGDGSMVLPLREYFCQVAASDVRDYGFPGTLIDDFLLPVPATDAEWLVTNPPFRLGEQFISLALARAGRGVAMLVRTAFLESADRYAKLFSVTPPSDILQFVERVPMFKGRLDRNGSTATAYCWLVFRKNVHGAPFSRTTAFHWIPPCRRRLERDSDYE
jgi:hypothetical protein